MQEAWAVGPALADWICRPASILDLFSRQRRPAGRADLLGELVEVTVRTLGRGVQLLACLTYAAQRASSIC
jgi:hypothetical protein